MKISLLIIFLFIFKASFPQVYNTKIERNNLKSLNNLAFYFTPFKAGEFDKESGYKFGIGGYYSYKNKFSFGADISKNYKTNYLKRYPSLRIPKKTQANNIYIDLLSQIFFEGKTKSHYVSKKEIFGYYAKGESTRINSFRQKALRFGVNYNRSLMVGYFKGYHINSSNLISDYYGYTINNAYIANVGYGYRILNDYKIVNSNSVKQYTNKSFDVVLYADLLISYYNQLEDIIIANSNNTLIPNGRFVVSKNTKNNLVGFRTGISVKNMKPLYTGYNFEFNMLPMPGEFVQRIYFFMGFSVGFSADVNKNKIK